MLRPWGGDAVSTPEKWYAIRVRSNAEKITAAHLESRGYAPLLPLYRSRRTWSDRLKTIDLPLFPGYIFCSFAISKRLPIISAPGVVNIVGAGKCPIPVHEDEIAALQAISKAGCPVEPWPYLHCGQRVRIDRGALCGIEGMLVEMRKMHRIVVSVTLLQRSVSVEIDRDWVVPVRSATFEMASSA
jgi:transcription antitermination factor NusG